MSRARMLIESQYMRSASVTDTDTKPGVTVNYADTKKLVEGGYLEPGLQWIDPCGRVKKIVAHENDRPNIVMRKLDAGWVPLKDYAQVLPKFDAEAQVHILAAARAAGFAPSPAPAKPVDAPKPTEPPKP